MRTMGTLAPRQDDRGRDDGRQSKGEQEDMDERGGPRWCDEDEALGLTDPLGAHTSARYAAFLRAFARRDAVASETAFAQLLSVVELAEELRLEEQSSEGPPEQPPRELRMLERLARTGRSVVLLSRLNRVLDGTGVLTGPGEQAGEWRSSLSRERAERVARFRRLLSEASGQGVALKEGGVRGEGSTPRYSLMGEVSEEHEQLRVLTLLKSELEAYGNDSVHGASDADDAGAEDMLMLAEQQLMVDAFEYVAEQANVMVMAIPPWFTTSHGTGGSQDHSTVDDGEVARWGVQVVSVPAIDGLIEQNAHIWWELHHPHIVKLMGACHVGRSRVAAHEKTRPMTEFLTALHRSGSRTDTGECLDSSIRATVRQRLLEAALAVRYLQEMGIVCAELSPDKFTCAAFRDKTMMLGWDLVSLRKLAEWGTAGPLSEAEAKWSGLTLCGVDPSISWWAPERDSQPDPALPSFATDVYSLGLCFLEFLALALTGAGYVSSLVAGESKIALPTQRPQFVDDLEWDLLQKMTAASPDTRADIRFVVERLKTLTESDPARRIQDARHVTLASTLGTLSQLLFAVEGRCRTSSDRKFHARVLNLQSKLASGELHSSESSSLFLPKLVELVRQFKNMLDQFSASSVAAQASSARQMTENSVMYHMELDRLLTLAEVPVAKRDAIHQWKPQYDASSWTKILRLHDRVDSSMEKPATVTDADEAQVLAQFESRKTWGQLITVGGNEPGEVEIPRWFIPVYEVSRQQFIDRGSFGNVYHGKWFDTSVIVKEVIPLSERERPGLEDDVELERQFVKEADIWFKLSHINIVQMYGACHVGARRFFVAEFAAGGTLDSFLLSRGRDMHLIWLSLLYAALGLRYLHDVGVVHGDLKCNNILVGADGVAKLTDFGLSEVRKRGKAKNSHSGKSVGAFRWKAPECLSGQEPTFESDIFSFGMCIIEAVTGTFPWGAELPDAAVKFHVKRGRLPQRPTGCFQDEGEWELIRDMCALDPAQRIAITSVTVRLLSLIEKRELRRVRLRQLGAFKDQQNRVISEGNTLLTLVKLTERGFASNPSVAKCSLRHLSMMNSNDVGAGRSRSLVLTQLHTLVKCDDESRRVWAAIATGYLANEETIEKTESADMDADQDVINALLSVIEDMENPLCEEAITALGCMSSSRLCCAQMIVDAQEHAAIALLVDFIRAGETSRREKAARTLGMLAHAEGVAAEIERSNGIKALVDLIVIGTYQEMDVGEWAVRRLLACTEGFERSRVVLAAQRAASTVWPKCMDRKDRQLVLEQLLFNAQEMLDTSVSPETSSSSSITALVAIYLSGNAREKQEAVLALNEAVGRVHDASRTERSTAEIEGIVDPLVELMRDGSDAEKQEAAQIVGRLSVESGRNRAAFVAAGAIPSLVELVTIGTTGQQLSAFWALENLADATSLADGDQEFGTAREIIERLVELIRTGSAPEKCEAARRIGNLAEAVDGLCEEIGSMPGVIPELLNLLTGVNSDDGQLGRAARSLGILAAGSAKNRDIMTSDVRTIPALVALVKTRSFHPTTWSIWTLIHLARQGTDAVCGAIVDCGAIPELVELLSTGESSEQRAWAAWALDTLAGRSAFMQASITTAGALPVLVSMMSERDDDSAEDVPARATSALASLAEGATSSEREGMRRLGADRLADQLLATGTIAQMHSAGRLIKILGDSHTS